MEVSKVFTSLLKFVGRANTTKSVSSKKLLVLFLKSKFIGFLSRYFCINGSDIGEIYFFNKEIFFLSMSITVVGTNLLIKTADERPTYPAPKTTTLLIIVKPHFYNNFYYLLKIKSDRFHIALLSLDMSFLEV